MIYADTIKVTGSLERKIECCKGLNRVEVEAKTPTFTMNRR